MIRSKLATTLFLSVLAFTGLAVADVKKDGTWPGDEKNVSLDIDRKPRSEAIRKLAENAGWDVVENKVPDDLVDVHVKAQPPSKVLDVLLADGEWTAKRDGTLVVIGPSAIVDAATTATPAVVPPPVPPPPPSISAVAISQQRGEDRIVRGGNLTIEKNETAHDVSVLGGNLEVYGTVTGNLTVMGGEAHVREGAHVVGNASVVGGELVVDDGSQVDGNVGVIGGSLHRGDTARIGGAQIEGGHDEKHGKSLGERVSGALAGTALLFLFGAVLFALAGKRMEELRIETASRPMRSLAMGVVGILASLVLAVALAITVIGIPVLIIAAILAVFATYAGICAVLSTLGKALVGHKTDNPYFHLAIGCAIFLLTGPIPFIGPLVTITVILMGIGVVTATRGAGYFLQKNGSAAMVTAYSPYR